MKFYLIVISLSLGTLLFANPFADTSKKALDFEAKTVGHYAQMRLFTNRWTKGKKVELMYVKTTSYFVAIMFGKGKAYIDANTVADNINPPPESNTSKENAEQNATVATSVIEDEVSFADLFGLIENKKEEELTWRGAPRAPVDVKINQYGGMNEHIGRAGNSSVAVYTSVPLREGECESIEQMVYDICLREQDNIFCAVNLTPVECGGNLRGER